MKPEKSKNIIPKILNGIDMGQQHSFIDLFTTKYGGQSAFEKKVPSTQQ